MLKKNGFLLLLALLIFGVTTVLAGNPKEPKGPITITVEGGTKQAKFDHPAHTKKVKNCQDCHHEDKAGAEQKCSGCHTKEGKDKAKPAKQAFHKQCGDCHKKEAKGPVPDPKNTKSCNECHVKKEG